MLSTETHLPIISVIIPVHNASTTLSSCLEALAASDDSSCEYIIVDDGSSDGSASIARKFPVQVIGTAGGPFGPAHARNRGAELAQGSILFFVDADVVLAPGALERVRNVFHQQPEVAAVFGSYDANPKNNGVISQYRNLLHHFVHQNGKLDASTFWAGCGAIRRSIFDEIGGFDERRFERPSIEDIDLGYRLRQAGYRILLDKDLQGCHLKRWTFSSLIWTDITCRAMPWSRLILETKQLPNDLNLKLGQRVSFALVAVAVALLAFAVFQPAFLAGSSAALIGVAVINRDLYRFFFRQRGLLFAAACIPLHLLYYLYSGFTYLYVWTAFQLKNTPSPARTNKIETDFRAKNAKTAKF